MLAPACSFRRRLTARRDDNRYIMTVNHCLGDTAGSGFQLRRRDRYLVMNLSFSAALEQQACDQRLCASSRAPRQRLISHFHRFGGFPCRST